MKRIIQVEKALKIACKKEWPNYKPSECVIEKLMVLAVELPQKRGRRLGLRYPAHFAACLTEEAKIRVNAVRANVYAESFCRFTTARLKRRRFYARANRKERRFRRSLKGRGWWPWRE